MTYNLFGGTLNPTLLLLHTTVQIELLQRHWSLRVSATSSKHFSFYVKPCVFSASEIFLLIRYTNLHLLTYLLTYLLTGAEMNKNIGKHNTGFS